MNTQYQGFNQVRNNLKYLHDFKKPLTKVLEKLIYGNSLFEYQNDDFEYYYIDKNKEVLDFIYDLKKDELTIDTEIEVCITKLAALLELKEEIETINFKYFLKN